MKINLEIEIKGLNQLTESLALIGSALAYKNNMVDTSGEAVDLLLDVTDKIDDHTNEEEIKKEVVKKVVSEVAEEPKAKEETKEVESKYTREDVRAAFVEKNSPSMRDKLKGILDKFDTPNITELKEEHFEDVMKELEAL